MTAMIKAAGRNFAALIGLFAVFLLAFIICTTLFSAGVGMAVIGVGLFILIGALVPSPRWQPGVPYRPRWMSNRSNSPTPRRTPPTS